MKHQPNQADILAVDDTPANLDLLATMLKESGYAVRAASTPELALQSAMVQPPALMLLDIRMPGMDGFEVCRRMKQDARTRHVPIIFISGQNDVSDRVRGFQLGAVDFISKPFQRDEILARVHTHLALHQAHVELERRVVERTAELQESLLQLRKTQEAMDLAGIGIFWLDPDMGGFSYVNDYFCQASGYSREALLGMTMPDLDPALSEGTFAEFSTHYQQNGTGRYEVEYRHKDGHLFPVEVTLYYYPPQSGKPGHFIGFMSDITERKEIARALSQHAEEQAALLEMGRELSETHDLAPLLQIVAQRITEMTEMKSSALYLWQGDRLILSATMPPLPDDFPDALRHATLAEHPHIRRAIETGQAVFVEDTGKAELTPAERSAVEMRGLRSIIFLPLHVGNAVSGVLIAATTGGQKICFERAIDLCSVYANMAALAIANANLYASVIEYSERLEQQYAFTHAILENAPMGMHMYQQMDDGSLVFQQGNPAASRILGVDVSQYVGKIFEEACPCLAQTEALSRYRQIASEGGEWLSDQVVYDQGAVQAVFEIKAFQTNPGQLAVFFEDVTQTRAQERALRQSEEKLRTILDGVDACIYLKDTEGRYLFANRLVRELWQAEMDDIIGFGDEKFFDAETTENIRRNDRRVLVDGEILRTEETNTISCTGNTATFLTVKLPLHKEDGTIYALCGISTDITERKRAEVALSESEARFRGLVEASSDWIWEVDAVGRYTYASPQIEELLGYSPEEVLGRTPFDLMPPDEASRVGLIFAEIAAARRPFHLLENINLHKNGQQVVLETSGTPIFNADGELTGYRGIDRNITQRKIAEERDRLFLDTMEASVMGIYIIQGLRFRYVNPAFAAMFGYAPAEMIDNMGPVELVIPEQRDKVAENLRRRALGESGKPYEVKCNRKDGSVFDIMVWGKGVEYEGQLASVGTAIDLTERKAAEVKIRIDHEQQTILRELLEYSLMDAPLEETLERCLDRLLQASWLSILPKGRIFLTKKGQPKLRLAISRNVSCEIAEKCEELDFGVCLCGRAAASAKVVFAEHVDERHEISYPGMPDHGHYCLPLVAKEQAMGVLLLYLPGGTHPDKDRESFLGAVAGILAGYISRKAGEQALAEHQDTLELSIIERTADLIISEARTRAIVTTMIDGVIQINARGIILSVNDAVENMFGYREDELVEQNISILMPEPVASAHDGYLSRYLQTRERHIIGTRREVMARHRDGSLFPVELAVRELIDEKGSVFIGVVRDLTVQKMAEQEVWQALQAAQSAAEAKSNFLANMSHEIRTPLNAVLGLTQIGMRDYKGREVADLFRRIGESGRHLLSVVNDILDFSKIEAGKLRVEKRPFALFSVIDNVKSFVAMRAEEKGLALLVSFAPDLSDWVEGDALRLTQILTNLLSNAIKFTERGEVMLRIARSGDDIHFMVVDSGIGMSEEQLKRLFQPFEQADSSTTRNFGGTGLGLAISRELARMMGGDISADSRPGEGSSFYLQLPMPVVAAPVQQGKRELIAEGGGARLKGLSVLAADDVDINRFVLEDMLAHEGAHVVFASNGQETLDLLEEEGVSAFDVVLMDVQMPVMDGLEATRRIVQIAPALPVIGLTAHAMAEERDKCLAAGMVDHVTKPVEIDILVSSIRRHVAGLIAQPVAVAEAAPATLSVDKGALGEAVVAGCHDPDIIDLAILAGRVGNDPAKVAKFAGRFVETAQTTLAEMQAAVAAGDLPTLGGLGHRLKSAALTVGAMRFGALCQELESFKAGGEIDVARKKVDELNGLYEQIAQRIRDIV